MRFLITGATGFIGRHLCDMLLTQGHTVVAALRSNALDIVSPRLTSIRVGDIDASTDWSAACKDVDVVIHLAARVHMLRESNADLSAYLNANYHATVTLARTAHSQGVRRMVFLSSIKVNGEFTDIAPFSADSIPHPQDPYAVSKHHAEKALLQLSKETGMEVVIVRPPLVYGPGVKANFLNLLASLDKFIPFPLASVQNRRSLIYVENLADAIIVCARHPEAASQVYLVSDSDISTPDLIRRLAHALKKRCFIYPFPILIMRALAGLLGKASVIDRLVQSLVVDSSKIRNELGWQPPFTQKQGFEATAAWYLKHKENQ